MESEDSCQVKPHSKPWAVRLEIGSSRFCGGILIGAKSVLTAAHCICLLSLGGLNCTYWRQTTVILGDHHITNTDCRDRIENEQCFDVQYGEPHPKYNGNS